MSCPTKLSTWSMLQNFVPNFPIAPISYIYISNIYYVLPIKAPMIFI